MRLHHLSVFILAAITGAASAHGTAPVSDAPAAQNSSLSAVGLVVRDSDGKTRRFSDLGGKKRLLVTFFPKCFTGNCTHQLTSLRDSYAALQKAGVEVWAVTTDSAEGPRGARAYARELKLPFPLLADTDRKLSLRFGTVQSPLQMTARAALFFDRDGKLLWSDKQMNPRTHGPDVLARVRAINTKK